jgi:DNA-binding NarL/FixJ family response regulator
MTNKLHILLVDDDPHVIEYLKTALEKECTYTISATTSGKDALTIMRERPPDLLILDLNMPEPDGFDLLRVGRAEFPYLRILVISGYLHGALLKIAKLLGAIATMEKPVMPDALVTTVREILGTREIRRKGVGDDAEDC